MKKKNHYVAQAYLENWIGADSKLWTYRTVVDHARKRLWKPMSVKSVAFHEHLYTHQLIDDTLETWFGSEFESPAHRALQRVVNDCRLCRDDWKRLVRYFALHDIRHPSRLQAHLQQGPAELKEILTEIGQDLENRLQISDPKDLREATTMFSRLIPLKITPLDAENSEKVELKLESYVGRSSWIYEVRYALEHTSRILHEHRWTILKPCRGLKWFTTDRPTIRLRFFDSARYDLYGGWNGKNVHLFMPLSPDHLLYAPIGQYPVVRGTRLNEQETMFIRKVIAENAHRYIFSSDRDTQIEELRPRKIDAMLLNSERSFWSNWNSTNAALEEEYTERTTGI